MHSWIFRHRAELSQLYGVTPNAARATDEDGAGEVDTREAHAGKVHRRRRYVVLWPMPPALSTGAQARPQI